MINYSYKPKPQATFAYLPSEEQKQFFNYEIKIKNYESDFKIIHYQFLIINYKTYDPVLGRFDRYDNYIQSPTNSQNYNRYAYVLNNPLKYSDPSGDLFFTIISSVVDLIKTAFFDGGLDLTSSESMGKAWKNYDPTASWSMTNKAYKIDEGLITLDRNKNPWGQAWKFVSRVTWQLPQTIMGYVSSGVHNLFGGVKSVSYYGGATVVESYSEKWGAFTLGNYIVGSRDIYADPNNSLFQHEYGHYIQSQESGPWYLTKYGIPSLLSNGDHNSHPVEQDANVKAFKYFNKHINNYNGWKYLKDQNPIIGYDLTLPYNSETNQKILRSKILKLEWYDYVTMPTPHNALLNMIIYNNR